MGSPPAFQLYSDDFLAGTMDMSAEEVGVYIRLLCLQWNRGYVDERAAKSVGGSAEARTWVLDHKFQRLSDKHPTWINNRLEEVREKAFAYWEKQRENGKKGGRPKNPNVTQKNPTVNSGLTQTVKKTITQTKPKKTSPSPSPSPNTSPTSSSDSNSPDGSYAACPEPLAPDRPAMVFCVKGNPPEWGLPQAKLNEWLETYVGLDVRGELAKANQWQRDNPVKRKTARGMTAFLGRWLSRANDKPRPAENGDDGFNAKMDALFGDSK